MHATGDKEIIGDFEFDADKEEHRCHNRTDFTAFGGQHMSACTYVYSPPTQGWNASSSAQLKRLEVLGQSFAMP